MHAKKSSVLLKKPPSIRHKHHHTSTVRKHRFRVFAHRFSFFNTTFRNQRTVVTTLLVVNVAACEPPSKSDPVVRP